jgi:type I restriction enzyme M protein
MYGAILGDIIGSRFEFDEDCTSTDFELFTEDSRWTDDTVLTVAVAEALLNAGNDAGVDEIKKYCIKSFQKWGWAYPFAGYGPSFSTWLQFEEPEPMDSFGNGSAMRVSPAGWLYDTVKRTREAARATAWVSHNHPEGLKGAECVAAVIFLARTGHRKSEIEEYVNREFGYDYSETLEEMRLKRKHTATCQDSLPKALRCFFDGTNLERVIRNAVSLGGDTDTIAAIAGSMAEAYYGVPAVLKQECETRLEEGMREILFAFLKSTKERVYRQPEDSERKITVNPYEVDIARTAAEFRRKLSEMDKTGDTRSLERSMEYMHENPCEFKTGWYCKNIAEAGYEPEFIDFMRRYCEEGIEAGEYSIEGIHIASEGFKFLFVNDEPAWRIVYDPGRIIPEQVFPGRQLPEKLIKAFLLIIRSTVPDAELWRRQRISECFKDKANKTFDAFICEGKSLMPVQKVKRLLLKVLPKTSEKCVKEDFEALKTCLMRLEKIELREQGSIALTFGRDVVGWHQYMDYLSGILRPGLEETTDLLTHLTGLYNFIKSANKIVLTYDLFSGEAGYGVKFSIPERWIFEEPWRKEELFAYRGKKFKE